MVIVDTLAGARIRGFLHADGRTVPLADRDLQRHRKGPVVPLLIVAGRQVEAAAAPQVPAPGEIQQLGLLVIKTAHANPGRADVAIVAHIKGQRILIAITTQGRQRLAVVIVNDGLIVEGQVAEPALAASVLGGDAEGAGAVLVTPVELAAVVTPHPALRPR